MVRIVYLATALFGLGAYTEAKQRAVHGGAHALSKDMGESLAKIANRFLSKSDIQAMIDLSSPKDQIINEIDQLQKEIIKECHAETDTFNEWLQSKSSDLLADQQQLQALEDHETDVKNRIDQLQGELNGATEEQNNIQQQLDQAKADLQTYQQQLADAEDERQKSHDQNEVVIKQHQDALVVLKGLRDLVVNIDVSTKEVMTKQLAKLSKANFLMKKQVSKINGLIDAVKAEVAKAMTKDPQEKQAIKDKLLGMIDQIMNGIQDSLTLYENQEEGLRQKFENEVKPGLEQLISQTNDRIAALQSQLADVIADHGSIQSDLDTATQDLSQTEDQITTLKGVIGTLEDQIQEGTDAHNQKQLKCKSDLDDLEEIRQYVVDNVQGMTPGNNCHPESPDCPRCLYDDHCSNGQVCSDEGVCSAPQTTPPKQPYSALITSVVGPQQARRVDVGVVPQEAFANGDFTYIFKYQQLADSPSWGNLFNVLNNGDGWPFPNQAALFLVNNMFEIDVCDDSLEWSQNYWYRNFYIDAVEVGQWNAIAFIVSSSTKTVAMVHRNSEGKVKIQTYPDFHGKPKQFAETGIYVNGRGYNNLNANFDDFRRYEHALTEDEVAGVFQEFFP